MLAWGFISNMYTYNISMVLCPMATNCTPTYSRHTYSYIYIYTINTHTHTHREREREIHVQWVMLVQFSSWRPACLGTSYPLSHRWPLRFGRGPQACYSLARGQSPQDSFPSPLPRLSEISHIECFLLFFSRCMTYV